MQDRLMKYYISKDYTFFLNHNSAELMRDINKIRRCSMQRY